MGRVREIVGFRIEQVAPTYFVAVLVDETGYGYFRQSPCLCADQAAYGAIRGGTRPLPYLGMTRQIRGETVEIDDRSCTADPSGWMWQHHGHTHGTLDRLGRSALSEKTSTTRP